MDIDGSNPTNLSNNSGHDSNPHVSPDGNKIVFESGRDDQHEIYIVNIDGSNPTNLTSHEAHDRDPTFSPDGSSIVFQSNRDGSWEIHAMNIDGSNAHPLTNLLNPNLAAVQPYWSHGGLATSASLLPEEGDISTDSNVFFMSLTSGLSMVSLPLKPQTPYTARSFAEELSSTVVVKYDENRRRFVGFTLDAPGDGFPIEGGKGYIVNLNEAKDTVFVGAAWTNEPPASAAPVADKYTRGSDNTWAFVVSGKIPGGATTPENTDGYLVTVQNSRTHVVATGVIQSGYFAATFADLSRQSVVEVGDRLEVTVSDRNGEVASDRLLVTVTPEVIRQVVLPITPNNVGKPNRSLLLQNYPNPFNPETWIPYKLASPANISIEIYDAVGILVRRLELGQRDAGFYQSRNHAAYWDGSNNKGERVSSGIYFYHFQAGDYSATRKMIILK